MTTSKGADGSAYVHEHAGRWVVADYRDGRYYAPMTTGARRANGGGVHTIFGSLAYVVSGAYSYRRRTDALRRARDLFAEPEHVGPDDDDADPWPGDSGMAGMIDMGDGGRP